MCVWRGCWGGGGFERWATPKETIFSKNRESGEEGQMQSTAGKEGAEEYRRKEGVAGRQKKREGGMQEGQVH